MSHSESQTSLPFANVVVPLDGSPFADRALPTARSLADGLGAGLCVVSVAEDEVEASWLRGRLTEAGMNVADPGVRVVISEEPARAILDVTTELQPALVCMASHGRGRVAGAVLGSVAATIVRLGAQSAVIVGPNVDDAPRPTGGPILACVDGSAASEAVVPVAAQWARALGRSLLLCTVAEPTPSPNRPDVRDFRGHGPDDPEGYLDQLAARWATAGLEVEVHPIYNPINAEDGVIRFLREQPAELVALTTHGRTGVPRLALGSTAAGIIHGVPVPVLAVPLLD